MGAASAQATRPPREPRILGFGPLRGLRRGGLRVEKVEGDFGSLTGDVLLLDGTLPAARLLRLLGKLKGDPPATLLVLCQGAKAPTALLEAVDDVLTDSDSLPLRIRFALRRKELKRSLALTTTDLRETASRLDGLVRRMSDDLKLAGSVQRSLHPPPRRHPRLDLAREFIPVREIGGDYYDFVPLTDSTLAFGIGDVMGKGVPAALLAANLKASLRAHLFSGASDPSAVLARVNQLFWEVSPRGRFSSLFLSVFDFSRGVLLYSNAGHMPPLRIRPSGEVQDLDGGSTALGLVEEASYPLQQVDLEADDVLVFFSDGLTDRADRGGDLYGRQRLAEAVVRSRSDAARIALYTVLGDVQEWSGGVAAEDDMTLVVVKVR